MQIGDEIWVVSVHLAFTAVVIAVDFVYYSMVSLVHRSHCC